jgi:hypothetical protein
VIVIDLKHPRHLFTLTRKTPGWDEPPSMATLRPGAYLRAGIRRLFQAAGWFAVRVLFALLHLSWQLTAIVEFEADVVAEDGHTARTVLEEFLRDAGTRVAVHIAHRGPIGRRAPFSAPIGHLRLGVAEPNENEDPPLLWRVTGEATATLTVPARDADTNYIEADIDPVCVPWPIMQLQSWENQIRRTPVRRRPAH